MKYRYWGLIPSVLLCLSCSDVRVVGVSSQSSCEDALDVNQCLRAIDSPNSLDWVSDFEWGELNESLNDTLLRVSVQIPAQWHFEANLNSSQGLGAVILRSEAEIDLRVLRDGEFNDILLDNTLVEGFYVSTLSLNYARIEALKFIPRDPALTPELAFVAIASEGSQISYSQLFYKRDVLMDFGEVLPAESGVWSDTLDLEPFDRVYSPADLPEVLSKFSLVQDVTDFSSQNFPFISTRDDELETQVNVSGEYALSVYNSDSLDVELESFEFHIERDIN